MFVDVRGSGIWIVAPASDGGLTKLAVVDREGVGIARRPAVGDPAVEAFEHRDLVALLVVVRIARRVDLVGVGIGRARRGSDRALVAVVADAIAIFVELTTREARAVVVAVLDAIAVEIVVGGNACRAIRRCEIAGRAVSTRRVLAAGFVELCTAVGMTTGQCDDDEVPPHRRDGITYDAMTCW